MSDGVATVIIIIIRKMTRISHKYFVLRLTQNLQKKKSSKSVYEREIINFLFFCVYYLYGGNLVISQLIFVRTRRLI